MLVLDNLTTDIICEAFTAKVEGHKPEVRRGEWYLTETEQPEMWKYGIVLMDWHTWR